MSLLQVELFTDGACLGNPGPGGWAALLRCHGKERLLRGAHPHTTNNRMELTAVLEGLRALTGPCQVTVHTDSRYVQGVLVLDWKRKMNLDLIAGLDDLLKAHTVSFLWIAGHTGHPEHDRVDAAARAEAEQARTQPSLDADRITWRIETYRQQLQDLVTDLDRGAIYIEDLDRDLVARLVALLNVP